MNKVLVIAGTVDAKQIIDRLLKMDLEVSATVTTRLGNELLNYSEDIKIYEGRITKQRIANLVEELNPVCVIDASNPFAIEISQNVINACTINNVPYLRF